MSSARTALDETFRSLRVRNFRLFFTGQLISQIGNWLTLVAQTLLVLKLTDNGVALGALAAAQFGPVLLLGPWAGLVADRSDKRRLLLIVQTIAMLQSFTLAVLGFSHNPPVLAVYAVALVGGVTVAFDNPARRAFVVEMVPAENMNNAVSLNSALMTSSRVVGPALAGLLVATVGFGWCFLSDGLSYLAVIASLWMMRTDELRPAPPTQRGKGQVRAGLRYARRTPVLWTPLVMMAVVGTLSYNFQTVFPLFTTRDLHGTGTTFTILFSVVSVGALIGALWVARRTTISVHTVAMAALGYGAALGGDGGRAEQGGGVRPRARARHHQHRLPHRFDGDRADRGGSRHARSRPRAASGALPRQHADRRTDRRLGVTGVRRPLRRRPRRDRSRPRRRLGLDAGPPAGRGAAAPEGPRSGDDRGRHRAHRRRAMIA